MQIEVMTLKIIIFVVANFYEEQEFYKLDYQMDF